MRTLTFCLAWILAAAGGANALTLGSKTFKTNTVLPMSAVYDAASCTGQNHSPELHWSDVPKGTKSFALTVHDPDAPAPGGFDHWLAYNIPASTRRLPQAVKLTADRQGINGFGKTEYDGPCPPPGKAHHYVFTLYALDVAHIGAGGMIGTQLIGQLHGHILASTQLTGLYGRR